MRRHIVLISAASLALAAIVGAACKATTVRENGGDDDDAGGDNTTTPAPTNDDNGTGDDGGTNSSGETNTITGLPCDVEAVLQNNCTVCHTSGSPYDAGPPPLVTYSDLKLMATADPTQTRAALSVQYMTAHTMPKPPAEPVDQDEITTISSWIDAGYPQNTTACEDVLPDGGSVDAGTTDAGSDAGVDAGYDGGCLNGAWVDANKGSELMHPGDACIACHTVVKGPKYRFAGTVFPHAGEPNDCNGDPTPVTVTITDANKKSVTVATNAAGNFGIDPANLTAPYNVKLTQGANTRAMVGTIAAGDCNGCHTASGAPGRVLSPVAP